jgi:hypothetical protein
MVELARRCLSFQLLLLNTEASLPSVESRHLRQEGIVPQPFLPYNFLSIGSSVGLYLIKLWNAEGRIFPMFGSGRGRSGNSNFKIKFDIVSKLHHKGVS